MQPPVEYPEDGKEYRWDEDTVNWVEMTNVVTNVEEND
jgi:hypothetical protein